MTEWGLQLWTHVPATHLEIFSWGIIEFSAFGMAGSCEVLSWVLQSMMMLVPSLAIRLLPFEVEQIEQVFALASKQKVWDHFSKAQRKNLETWRKQAQVSYRTGRLLLSPWWVRVGGSVGAMAWFARSLTGNNLMGQIGQWVLGLPDL